MTRKVFVGTPCYDGRADVWYVNSLLQTERLVRNFDIELIPIWLSYDALIQRARNDCVALALELGCDDMVFIDSDLEWEPEWFLKLLQHPVDVVGGTYRKKTDEEEMYVVRALPNINLKTDPTTGLIEVEGLGTGFLRLSHKAMQWLWDNSEPYNEMSEGKHRRWIFDVAIENGSLVSEDIRVCKKLKQAGFSIWLDPELTLSHIGPKKFKGDFQAWAQKLIKPKPVNSVKTLYL